MEDKSFDHVDAVIAEGVLHAGKGSLHRKLTPNADIARDARLTGDVPGLSGLEHSGHIRESGAPAGHLEVRAEQRLLGNASKSRRDFLLFFRRRIADVEHVDLHLRLLRGCIRGLLRALPETWQRGNNDP